MQERDFVLTGPPVGAGNPETRLLADYLEHTFPGYVVATNQPLGRTLDPAQTGGIRKLGTLTSRPWMPRVDAYVIMAPPGQVRIAMERTVVHIEAAPPGTVLLLVEAKIRKILDGIAKLPLYRELARVSEHLGPLAQGEIRLRLVTVQDIPWVSQVASIAGVEVDTYRPAWIGAYYDYSDHYWTRQYQERRAQILELRRKLGL